jgi:hypothetical protein
MQPTIVFSQDFWRGLSFFCSVIPPHFINIYSMKMAVAFKSASIIQLSSAIIGNTDFFEKY